MARLTPIRARRLLLRLCAVLGAPTLYISGRTTSVEQDLLDEGGMPYSAFDRMPFESVQIGDAQIRVVFGPGTTSMPADEFEAARQMFAEAGVKYQPVEGAGRLEP